MERDRYGNIVCPHCNKPCCPVTGVNLSGICWDCCKAWKRRMHERAQAEIDREVETILRGAA